MLQACVVLKQFKNRSCRYRTLSFPDLESTTFQISRTRSLYAFPPASLLISLPLDRFRRRPQFNSPTVCPVYSFVASDAKRFRHRGHVEVVQVGRAGPDGGLSQRSKPKSSTVYYTVSPEKSIFSSWIIDRYFLKLPRDLCVRSYACLYSRWKAGI